MEEAEWEQAKLEWHRKLADEDALIAGGRKALAKGFRPSIRSLARQWEHRLERPGTCCLSPLQKDDAVELFDGGLRAACRAVRSRGLGVGSSGGGGSAVFGGAVEDEGACQRLGMGGVPCGHAAGGIKGLPAVRGGRYQFEVELLADGALIVGWSSATCLPSAFDGGLAFGYASTGCRAGGGLGDYGCGGAGAGTAAAAGAAAYGPPFGKPGDVVGALLDWSGGADLAADGGAVFGPMLSFVLNGRPLGVAFDLRDGGSSVAGGLPPLQMHLCQAQGPPFEVLLRGATRAAPLRFPVDGYRPLADVDEAHFSPFSAAVTGATAWTASFRSYDFRATAFGAAPPTVARRLIHGSLGLPMPLSHLAQEREAERRISGRVAAIGTNGKGGGGSASAGASATLTPREVHLRVSCASGGVSAAAASLTPHDDGRHRGVRRSRGVFQGGAVASAVASAAAAAARTCGHPRPVVIKRRPAAFTR